MADKTSRCGCNRCQGCILRRRWRGRGLLIYRGWRSLVDRRGRLVHRRWCRAVRDFHETFAAELVARSDRVATRMADKTSRCGCNRGRGCILRRRWGRLLVYRRWWWSLVDRRWGGLVYRCRCLVGRCRCRGDISGPCTAAPAELLVRSERCTTGTAPQPSGRRGRGRSWRGRYFDE
jgi:hypothetical protein